MGVWSSGEVYESLIPYPDGRVIFTRTYARNTPTKEIWEDLRKIAVNWFIHTFWLGSVWTTKPPSQPTGKPEDLWQQSKHIQRRVLEHPEDYEFGTTDVTKTPKWHIKKEGYEAGLERAYVNMLMGIGTDETGYIQEEGNAISILDKIQELKRGETIEVILFVYPDRYDEEIRAMLVLEIEFYD
jgi:hypothetical protein